MIKFLGVTKKKSYDSSLCRRQVTLKVLLLRNEIGLGDNNLKEVTYKFEIRNDS